MVHHLSLLPLLVLLLSAEFQVSSCNLSLYLLSLERLERNMHNLYRDILKIAEEKLQNQKFFYIAIDGPCASGKSHLANELKKFLDASVISMDDFFLSIDQRTEARYAEVGGNIDYERFEEEIINHRDDETFSHFRYNCMNLAFEGPKTIAKKPIIIVEGSYSLHPKFQELYDLNIFLKISNELKMERLKERNPDNYQDFINRWIPLEEKYFDSFKIEDKADIIIYTE